MQRVEGVAIMMKINGLFFAGLTDTDLSITPTFVESLIKEDKGKPQKKRIGAERSISISGVVCINDSGDDATHMSSAGVMAAADAGTVIPFCYGMLTSGKPEVTGNLRLKSYSEKGSTSDYATWSADGEIIDDDDFEIGATE